MKYETVTYGKGWAIEVTPEDRSVDVMHYLLTGHLLCGRSLEGVSWVELDDDHKYVKLQKKRAEQLMKSIKNTHETVKNNIP